MPQPYSLTLLRACAPAYCRIAPRLTSPRCLHVNASSSRQIINPKVSSGARIRSYADSSKNNRNPGAVDGGTLTDDLVSTVSEEARAAVTQAPFYFLAGFALFAKRPSRPFPPPFLSPPSSSFSEPLSTHNRAVDKRLQNFEGIPIRGITNGDDAVLVSDRMIAANDGVGAWGQKERGHAPLWSRLIIHFWSLEAERDKYGTESNPDPRAYLQRAYDQTKAATAPPNQWFGTTTASGALIHNTLNEPVRPLVLVTQLGDSQILVVRPRDKSVVFKSIEQWHWFDCPRQLGTNSPDTPDENAIVDTVEVEEDDIVLAMSDGVSDNLWEHEIVRIVLESFAKLSEGDEKEPTAEGMQAVAHDLVQAAKQIAMDPFAESPFMERAIEEGLPTEGGKLDDISVVAALCKKRV